MLKEFGIFINNDTLNIGETFQASIWTNKNDYTIDLEMPDKRTVNSDDVIDSYTFEKLCDNKGEFVFKGTIYYDGEMSFPFVYRYLVE